MTFMSQPNLSVLIYVGKLWVVVVAQLVEWLLLRPETGGSNPDIGKIDLPIVQSKRQK